MYVHFQYIFNVIFAENIHQAYSNFKIKEVFNMFQH